MKTILLALEFPPRVGGVENYYANLANNWPDEFVVIDNQENKLLAKSWPVLKWLKSYFTILQTLRQAQPDWLLLGEILPLGTAAWLASLNTKFNYAVFLHGLDFSLATKSSWKKWLSKKILTKAKLIICANSKTADLVKNFLGTNNKIEIINPGINPGLPAIRPELLAGLKSNYSLENNRILVSIGRLVKRKGIADVLTVLPEILEQQPNILYFIIGSGPEENNLRELIKDPSLSGKVFLLTNIKDEEKWAWLKLSDIFIMPAKDLNGDYEGFGIVYLEANLFGKPIIAANSGGVKDAVVDGLNGLLVAPNDANGLKQAILSLVNDKTLTDKLGEQGRARALNDFNWPKQTKKLYNSLITNS